MATERGPKPITSSGEAWAVRAPSPRSAASPKAGRRRRARAGMAATVDRRRPGELDPCRAARRTAGGELGAPAPWLYLRLMAQPKRRVAKKGETRAEETPKASAQKAPDIRRPPIKFKETQ